MAQAIVLILGIAVYSFLNFLYEAARTLYENTSDDHNRKNARWQIMAVLSVLRGLTAGTAGYLLAIV